MRYVLYSISIHAVCVLFYKYSCGMCFILYVFMWYVFYSISIHAVCVLFYKFISIHAVCGFFISIHAVFYFISFSLSWLS
jgi:hypothetical protein